MSAINEILLKLLLVAVTAPAWYPFLKEVWRELNLSMAEEGGLLGRIPNARELKKVEQERANREDPLVHEPWPTREERLAGRRRFRSQGQEKGSSSARSRPSVSPSRGRRSGGFR